MKVLIVDDNAQNLSLLAAMLDGAGCGYEVDSARNGAEALKKLEEEKFGLIISDILMPQMDGFELCHQVKKREALRHIPFIFYTATYTDQKDMELAERLGASRFIVKPTEPQDFLAIIRQAVQEYEAGRLEPASAPAEPEEVLLRAYNRRLVHKLERKVQQLEQEMDARRKAEEKVHRLNIELEARIHQRTAELAAANKELQTFASSVSHDLRTPLRAIEGYARIIDAASRDKLDERSRTCLRNIDGAVHRMDRLIEALLQLSRATRGELRRESVNLSQIAHDIEGNLRREQPERKVDLRIAPDLMTQGDPALLRSVLQNLLGNAWKYTAASPEPHIEFGRTPNHGQRVFFVRDNGIGFDNESAAKIFAPFQRLHGDKFPGTGIGLAIVEQIVHRHGGEIWASGEVGKGATFCFTLRKAVAEEEGRHRPEPEFP